MSRIVDAYGKVLPEVRESIGFVKQQLKTSEPEALTGISVRGAPERWIPDGCEAGSRGWRKELT